MARITVEDCTENVPNMFQLVLVAAKRARQLANGAEPMVAWENDKPTVVALRDPRPGRRALVSGALCGAAFVFKFTAVVPALGVWLFFLLQALYFAFFDSHSSILTGHANAPADPFEQAHQQAEEILS